MKNEPRARVRKARAAYLAARAEARRRWLAELQAAYDAGLSLREIAAETDTTHTQILRLLREGDDE